MKNPGRRLGILSAFTGVVLCFARVYIGGHYPQDVIGGFALGAVVVLIGWIIVRIPLTTLIRQLTATPLRPLLMARSRPVLAGGAEGGADGHDTYRGPAQDEGACRGGLTPGR